MRTAKKRITAWHIQVAREESHRLRLKAQGAEGQLAFEWLARAKAMDEIADYMEDLLRVDQIGN